ncbi:uncharacterized protein METZ01_LOCUS498389, partial [marine metagenome]
PRRRHRPRGDHRPPPRAPRREHRPPRTRRPPRHGRRRHPQPVDAPGRGPAPHPGRPQRRPRHPHSLGENPGLQRGRRLLPDPGPRRPRSLHLSAQGPRARPARRAAELAPQPRPCRGRGSPSAHRRRLRRRHQIPPSAEDQKASPQHSHRHAGHAARRHPGLSRSVGRILQAPEVRRHRRAPHLQRHLRQPHPPRPAPPQPHLCRLRQPASVHHLFGHHRQPARAGRQALQPRLR